MISSKINTIDGVPPEIEIMPAKGKAVIHIDTEQAKHRHLSNLKYGILKRVGLEKSPENLLSYNVRGLDITDCINLLDDVFTYANTTFGGVHACVIDGIADLINDVNDAESSNQIVKYFDEKATAYNTLIICIIHRNPNDSKTRGHLGSQLGRKQEAGLTIRKDGDNVYIDPDDLRTANKNDIPKYLFQFDKNKGYHVCIGESTDKAEESRFDYYTGLLNLLFKDGETSLEAKKLFPLMEKLTDKKITTCKTYLSEMITYGLIKKGKRGNYVHGLLGEEKDQE